MVRIEHANPYGPLTEERLSRFESAIGQRLPDDYRAFLLEHNGGDPEPAIFAIGEAEGTDVVQEFYGLHDGPDFLRLDRAWEGHREWVPATLIPIAYDPGGNMICLGVRGEERGTIFVWDHELAPGEGGIETFENITPIAPSFAVFLDSLYDDVAE